MQDLSAYEEYFAKAIKGDSTVSHPFPSVALLERGSGEPIAGTPTMLAVAAMKDDDGETLAVVALRVRPENDFANLLRAARAGDTGETYAFDRQGLMLSESRFEDQLKRIGLIPDRPDSKAMLRIEIRDPEVDMTSGERPTSSRSELMLTRMAASATVGKSDIDVSGYNDYRGVPVIGAWTWLDEYEFGVATELDLAEAYQPVYVLRTAFGLLFALLCASAIAILIAMFALSRLRSIAARASRKAKKLGQYHLEEKIGEGGMGEVYRARHAMLTRPTAVKLLKPDQVSQLALARFEREVQLSSQLTHPNTIQIYDYGRTDEGVFYYAMEYLDGLSLAELIRRHGPLSTGRALHILSQVCGSLSEAHAIGLIHRDIKPANIMLTCRGGVPDFAKVLDFGLAKNTEAEHAMTVTVANALAGTPLYFSPEATKGAKHLDQRSDIYSLGVVAFETLTGEPPFQGDSSIDICMQHATKRPPAVSENRSQPLPPGLDELIMQCLEKLPENRPQTASELRDQIERIAAADATWSDRDAMNWWQVSNEKENGTQLGAAETALF